MLTNHRDPASPGSASVAVRKRSVLLVAVDVVTCCVVVGIPFAYCLIRSPKRLFWIDEVLTELAVRDASFSQMIASLKDTINAMPPSYFVGLWLWTKGFGTSEVAFRTFSSLAMGCTWILCWLLLRQFCSRLTAVTAATTAIFCSQDVLRYSVEARCYAQYMAAFFAAGLLYVLCWNRPQRAGVAVIVATILAHALLVTTHYVGCIYSASLIVAAAIAGTLTHRRALIGYAVAAAIGAATFVFCLPFYLAQRSLGGTDRYMPLPGFAALMDVYGFGLEIRPIVVMIIAIVAFAYIVIRRCNQPADQTVLPPQSSEASNWNPNSSALLGAFTLCLTAALVPFAIWLESFVGIRLFNPRYMLPSLIIWPCILGLAIEELGVAANYCRRIVRGIRGSLVAISPKLCCALLLVLALRELRLAARTNDDGIRFVAEAVAATNQYGNPLVSTDLHDAVQMRHYGGQSRYVTIAGYQAGLHIRIADALDRQHWSDFVVPIDELRNGKWTFLIRRGEWETWLAEGFVPDDWRVVKPVGETLLIIER